VARFRLRFLLQEVDLPPGETIIGRSASCHVTIEDPLVSRQHAKITVRDDKAVIEDLGSRNGLMVNGRQVAGRLELNDGARLRIGTQELVLSRIATVQQQRAGAPGTRATGFMCHCAACGLPYPAELIQCPSCGSTERADEDTLSGVAGESQRNWSLELLVEVLDKAKALGRWEDVERVLRRAKGNIEQCIASGTALDRRPLDAVADAAVSLAVSRGEAEWGHWALTVYAALAWVPPSEVCRHLSTLPPSQRASLVPIAGRVVESVRARGGPETEDAESFRRIESLQDVPGAGGQ
jgi:hypothetical protein